MWLEDPTKTVAVGTGALVVGAILISIGITALNYLV
jgi:hypothetical protein